MQRIILPESEVCRMLTESINRERLPAHHIVVEKVTRIARREGETDYDLTIKKADVPAKSE